MEDHQVGKTLNKKQSCLQGSTPTGKTSEHQMKPEEVLSLLLLLGLILLFFIILFNFIVPILKLPGSGTRPPEFKVDQVVVFQFNIRSSHLDTLSVVTSSHLDSKSIVTFSVKNPNSYRSENIYCEDVMASVLYKDVNISSVRIEPFFTYQDQRISVPAIMGPTSMFIQGSNIADAIVADLSSGAVNFTVIVNGTAKINPWSIDGEAERKQMTVSCKDIKVVFPYTDEEFGGTMVGGPSKCNAKFI